MGYWNKDLGIPNRLTCTQCHDPHRPAFAKFQPLPRPHTLRMEAIPRTPGVGHAHGKTNPLRTWGSSNTAPAGRSRHPSGTTQLGTTEPEESESGGAESRALKPGGLESGSKEPGETKSELAKSGGAESGASESGGKSQEVSHE
jgi:hypothetical protein